MFPQSFINEVKEKVSLVELVSEYTPIHKAGSNIYIGPCPHPDHKDSDPSFRIWTKGYEGNEYDSWACMGCHYGSKDIKSKNSKNYGSDCFAFYQWMEGVSWKKAVYELCEKYNIPIPSSEFDKLYNTKRKQTESFIKNLYSMPRQYLYKRGLSDKDIDEWKIGFQGDKIVFPLMDKYKNVIAFTKRWIIVPEGRNDKYKNSKASKIFNKSFYFYGQHNITEECDEIRITEGTLDVILGTKYGINNLVATLGTAFTDEHAELIKNMNKTPVFIMDGDDAGIKAAEKAINKLASIGVYSKILILPIEKDLCDLSNELHFDIENYIQTNALTYGQYKLQKIVNHFDSQLNELKLKSFQEIKEVLEEIPYEAERMIMKQYILQKLNMQY